MSKYVKDILTEQLRTRFDGLDSALWVEMVGVDGITTNQFRRDLRARRMRADVVKNSVFRRACGEGPLRPLAEALTGPSLVITGGESVIDVAKLIEQWLPKIPKIKLRGAVLEGEYLDERRVAGLAKMPSKRDLQAGLAAAALSPGRKLSAAILAPGSAIAGCLKTLIEKLEKAEPAAAAQ
ncbi:MAG: 50S ribosomal protein L10 [Phycisphaerae bacterium]|nr:50S ribosomal protein L10 [Phycisphaerae bacterium]